MAIVTSEYPNSNLKHTYLHIGARIPVWVKQYHSVSTGEVHPHTPSSSCQQHDEYGLVGIEAINEGLGEKEHGRGAAKGHCVGLFIATSTWTRFVRWLVVLLAPVHVTKLILRGQDMACTRTSSRQLKGSVIQTRSRPEMVHSYASCLSGANRRTSI